MPKGKAKKKGARKPVRKSIVKKKTATEKVAKKKTARKKSVKKKAAKKKTTRKKAASKTPPGARRMTISKKTMGVEPGPSPAGIPPVEEPAVNEEAIGTITHYYSHLSVAVIQINKGALKTGDTIHVKGHSTDFTQQLESMEYEHQHVDQASAGQSVGIKVKNHAREHDIVYVVR